MTSGSPSLAGARVCLVLSAVLWSLGSVFMRLLREPLGLGLDQPTLTPIQIAFYRGFFGGLFMLALVRRAEIAFRPAMLGMMVLFAAMSAMYLSALDGPAANAIFLQNTSPVWVFVFAVLVLGERGDRRGWTAVILAAAGAAIIVGGNWPRTNALHADDPSHNKQILQLLLGLGSGIVTAIIILFLRVLRDHSAAWLVALNLLGTAGTLGLFVLLVDGPSGFLDWVSAPSLKQFAVLAVFGSFQMALAYWFFTRGLQTVSSQEAAIITLIEPLLNPLWAYCITPEKDTPNIWMLSGGALILLALVWKYLPWTGNKTFSTGDGENVEIAEKKQDKPE
jgi:drug/metabolite transporter (DMT)-like permease